MTASARISDSPVAPVTSTRPPAGSQSARSAGAMRAGAMAFILRSRLFLIFLEVGLALLGECVDAFFRFLGIVQKLDRVARQQADAKAILTTGVEGTFGENRKRVV